MALSIAVFGNTNNYPLLLAQGLMELGHSVRLILNRKEILHRPEARYPNWAGAYPDWIFDCGDMTDDDIAYRTPAMDQAVHHLTHRVDLAILNDTGPAFAGYLRCPHVALLTGSDLAYWASFDMLHQRSAGWDPEFKRSPQGRRCLASFADLVARQRDGILGAEVVAGPYRGLVPSYDQLLDQIGVPDSRRLMIHLANTIDLDLQPPAHNTRLSILSGCRVVFRPEMHPQLSALDFKGTDVLLNGFGLYVKEGGMGRLRMVRKGQDLDAAMALISQLGIQSRVKWLDEMSLERFYQEMTAADLVCDQFGTSFPGMVTTDAYALGRPVMANLRNDIFGRRFPEPLPGFNASTPEEICSHLHAMGRDPRLLKAMGKKSRIYAETCLSPKKMAKELVNKVSSL